jgi:DNA-directed RNA polymerase specialized sigma subunit
MRTSLTRKVRQKILNDQKRVADLAQAKRERKVFQYGLEQAIAERIGELPEFQRKILALHCSEGLRLQEIAEVFGVCRSHVCQAYAQAILAIKPVLEAED